MKRMWNSKNCHCINEVRFVISEVSWPKSIFRSAYYQDDVLLADTAVQMGAFTRQ